MKYCPNPEMDEPVMLIDTHIGYDAEDGQGIDGALFQRELLQLDAKGKKRIEIWINSPGGVVLDAYNIFNAILNSKTPVDTYNTGMAASSAGFIWMAGRKRYMADYAIFMMHDPSGGSDNGMLKIMSASICTMLAAKSNISEDDVRSMMADTTYLDSNECLAKGFATEVIQTKEGNRKWMPVNGTTKQIWKSASLIMNKYLHIQNNQKTSVMLNKVTQKLGLMEGASEEIIVDAIKLVQDKVYTAELTAQQAKDNAEKQIREATDKAAADVKNAKAEVDAAKKEVEETKLEMGKVTNELTDVKTKLSDAEKQLKDVQDKVNAYEKEKNDAIAAQKLASAKSLVQGYVNTGRIKNDEKIIEKWVNQAVADFDGTKELIEAIPLSVKSPIVQTDITNKVDVNGINATNTVALAVRARMKRQGKEIPA